MQSKRTGKQVSAENGEETQALNRRMFVKMGAAASMLAGCSLQAQTAAVPRENWSGTFHFHTDTVLQPGSPAEVRSAVSSVSHVRALGTRHSFNGIADSTSAQISTLRLKDINLLPEQKAVRAGAGVRLGELSAEIDKQGWALHNLPSLPHISLGGCVSTATHGSGVRNGNLSTAVQAVDIVGADGQIFSLAREKDGDTFNGAVVSLGALGVMTHVTMDVQPRFDVAQTVYENLSFDQVGPHLQEIMGAAYSVSLFTHWDRHRAEQVWLKRRLQPGEVPPAAASTFFGATLAQKKLHPAGTDVDPTPCTEQGNVPGPWYQRLPHFKLEFTPSSGHEIQTEYFVPFERGSEAIRAIEALHERITPHLIVSEIRAIAADNLWLSMAYQRPSLSLHFTWKPDAEAVLATLPAIEAALAPFASRPHWAKVFTTSAATLASVYPRLNDFCALVQRRDPREKFTNELLRQWFPTLRQTA